MISNGVKKGDTVIVSVKNKDLVIEAKKGKSLSRSGAVKSNFVSKKSKKVS